MAYSFICSPLRCWTLAALLGFLGLASAAITVNSTILVIARDARSASTGAGVLDGYGIPWSLLVVPSTGASLPVLNSSSTSGNFGGFVVISEVAYSMSTGWGSALTSAQWQQLYDYQTAFGVRMVRLDVFPTSAFGVTSLGGTSVDQAVSISNSSAFSTANLVVGAGLSTSGLFHYQAQITDSSKAVEIAQFAARDNLPKSTAAVINSINGREQMVWFMPWAVDWSETSTLLSHAWIHFITRGIYLGFRRTYFSTQVDDMFLESPIYYPNGTKFRIRPDDLTAHIDWMKQINAKMPKGSEYWIEVAHNGNGNIKQAALLDASRRENCNPATAIQFNELKNIPSEWVKPIGSGVSIWPSTPARFTWSDSCCSLDPLEQFWANKANLNAFAHVSHTFTHENENNATYSDIVKEITWNQAWLRQVGIDRADRFSPNGLVPPAITGLHNGDALRAWSENGIKYAVGDNTRTSLLNKDWPFHPYITTVADSNFDGMVVVGRWATTIYFDCDTPDCIVTEWQTINNVQGTWDDIMKDAKVTNTRHLLGLHWDPFMFHQANLRYVDVPPITVNGVTQKYSLLMAWAETIVQEMTRLTTWPLISLKHDDIAQAWLARQTRDFCKPSLSWTLSDDRSAIISITLDAADLGCPTPIPVTFPVAAKALPWAKGSSRTEQVGTDAPTIWYSLAGEKVDFTLSSSLRITGSTVSWS